MIARKSKIQRIIFRVHPTANNPQYAAWQTAVIVFLIANDDPSAAIEVAKRELTKRHWAVIRYEEGSTLIEERVLEFGGDVWVAFKEARKHGLSVRIFPESIHGTKASPMMPPVPRLTEEFFDKMIDRAGGRRFQSPDPSDNKQPNADYLIDDAVVELKLLEEEGMEKEERQPFSGRLLTHRQKRRLITKSNHLFFNLFRLAFGRRAFKGFSSGYSLLYQKNDPHFFTTPSGGLRLTLNRLLTSTT